MKPTKEELDSVVSQVLDLTSIHAIWWEINNDSGDFEQIRDRYQWFFGPVLKAMHEDLMIIISKLFDRSSDSCSFHTLIKTLAKSEPRMARALERRVLQHGDQLRKCRQFRNKVHAHRDKRWLARDIYKELSVTFRDVDQICELCADLAVKLVEIAGTRLAEQVREDIKCYRDFAMSDFRHLIHDLANLVD